MLYVKITIIMNTFVTEVNRECFGFTIINVCGVVNI